MCNSKVLMQTWDISKVALYPSTVYYLVHSFAHLFTKYLSTTSSGPRLSLQMVIPCLQFSSVTQSCPTLCKPMDWSTLGLPVHHQLPEFTQTHVHWVGDAIQPSYPLSSPSPTFNLSQHQGVFKWVSSLHQVAKVLEFQLQHQSFQWIFRTDFSVFRGCEKTLWEMRK